MKIDGVFSGGGVKAYAFVGALKRVEERGLILERVAGTSAGAIVASLLAAEYTASDIQNMLDELDLQKLIDPPALTKVLPFTKWAFLYFQLGINKGNKLERWVYDKLARKDIYTFKDINSSYLKVVVSDISLGRLVVIPDDLERIYDINPETFPVAKAVRMSAGFPYFFIPKKLSSSKNKKSIIIDGGLLSNFPLWVFEDRDKKISRPILGMKLSESTLNNIAPRKINNALDMFHALFVTMKEAHDSRYISKSQKNNIIFIPIKNVGSINFDVREETKEQLMDTGYRSAKKFLEHWPR
ncbi:MAG: patatin-like phospholipase family protein [Bacillota bacterium]